MLTARRFYRRLISTLLARPHRNPARVRLGPRSAVWDEAMTLSDLRAQLDVALKTEDYSLAARIRDTLQ